MCCFLNSSNAFLRSRSVWVSSSGFGSSESPAFVIFSLYHAACLGAGLVDGPAPLSPMPPRLPKALMPPILPPPPPPPEDDRDEPLVAADDLRPRSRP